MTGKRRMPRRNPRTGQFVSARSKKRPTTNGSKRGGKYRKNPTIGPLVDVRYYKNGENRSLLSPLKHDAGDMGIAKIKSKAKLVEKGGKLSISGMRWIPGVGIVG